MTESPATTPIPVQLRGPEFIAFTFPHLSMPRRGPKCKLGYHRVFNLILWVLHTGMQWKCLPVPRAGGGTAVIHYTTIYKVFAKWIPDIYTRSLHRAGRRGVEELVELDLAVGLFHGDDGISQLDQVILLHVEQFLTDLFRLCFGRERNDDQVGHVGSLLVEAS
jgi:hypothetical protein